MAPPVAEFIAFLSVLEANAALSQRRARRDLAAGKQVIAAAAKNKSVIVFPTPKVCNAISKGWTALVARLLMLIAPPTQFFK